MSDTVATVISRAANLIPNARSGNLATHAAYVLTPAAELPEQFQQSQRDRNLAYMTLRDPLVNRITPGHAVAYFVTSYGQPIAWVTLDGRTHYADLSDAETVTVHATPASVRAMRRHQDAVRAVWPDRFAVDSQGPIARPFNGVTARPAGSGALGGSDLRYVSADDIARYFNG